MDSRTRRRPHKFVEQVDTDDSWTGDDGPFVNIVLVEPEIPQNTGTIVRLAAATACPLHLVEPLGFDIDERSIRRAGLDYWEHAHVQTYRSLEELRSADAERHPREANAKPSPEVGRFWLTSKKSTRPYTEVDYRSGDYLVFGRETAGLPEELIDSDPEHAITIPMFGPVRSLNLANAASIVVYEALRQLRGF